MEECEEGRCSKYHVVKVFRIKKIGFGRIGTWPYYTTDEDWLHNLSRLNGNLEVLSKPLRQESERFAAVNVAYQNFDFSAQSSILA